MSPAVSSFGRRGVRCEPEITGPAESTRGDLQRFLTAFAGGFVFCSGTVGIDPRTGEIAEGIEAQTELALRNIAAILEAAG